MPDPASNHAFGSQQYLAAVERIEELARLNAQAQARKSLLLFGAESVGKTRLLQAFVQGHSLALHAPRVRTPRELLLRLIAEIRRVTPGCRTLPAEQERLSTTSLKGVVLRALEERHYVLALDHLDAPSRVLAGLIKDLSSYDRTPVIFVARSPHMEDIGALRSISASRSERLELKEFAQPVALEFARRHAARSGLTAGNLDEALEQFVELSNGNPGSILCMLNMARNARYYTGDQIKARVLYLDYRMGRRGDDF